jgi:hypothetical protein
MKSFPRTHSMDEHVKSVNIVNILPLLSMRQNSFGVYNDTKTPIKMDNTAIQEEKEQ